MAGERIFELTIELKGVEPRVWRKIQIPTSHTFFEMGRDIMDAMGWEGWYDSGLLISSEDVDEFKPEDVIGEYLTEGMYFKYLYNPEDEWIHDIRVTEVMDAKPAVIYPRCIDGAMACPFDDIGGPEMYQDLLDRIYEARDCETEEEIEELFDEDSFMYQDWDPDDFELKYVNFTLVELSDAQQLLEDYIISSVNLYGIVSAQKVIEIYNLHHEQAPLPQIDVNTLKSGFLPIHENRLFSHGIVWIKGYFYEVSISSENEFEALMNAHEAKSWFIPETEEEMMDFRDIDHIFASKAYREFKEYLSRMDTPPGFTVEEIAFAIANGCNDILDSHACIKKFAEEGLEFMDPDDLQEGVALLEEVRNHARMWVNNGYTPEELSGMSENPFSK